MYNQPTKLIHKIIGAAVTFWLCAYLLRLGACYLSEIWWILAIVAGCALLALVLARLWKHRKWF